MAPSSVRSRAEHINVGIINDSNQMRLLIVAAMMRIKELGSRHRVRHSQLMYNLPREKYSDRVSKCL